MPAKNQTVIDAFGLGVFERREVGEGGGFGFVEDGAGAGLEFRPARPIEFGGVRDLAEQAAPFDDDAVDVARADEVVDVGVFGEGIFVDGGDDFLRARAVFRGDAVFEVAGNGLLAEELVASDGEAAGPAIFLAAKAGIRRRDSARS